MAPLSAEQTYAQTDDTVGTRQPMLQQNDKQTEELSRLLEERHAMIKLKNDEILLEGRFEVAKVKLGHNNQRLTFLIKEYETKREDIENRHYGAQLEISVGFKDGDPATIDGQFRLEKEKLMSETARQLVDLVRQYKKCMKPSAVTYPSNKSPTSWSVPLQP